MYYAEYHPYGIDTVSDGMELAAFDSMEDRAEWVDRMNAYHDKDKWVAVTTREAARKFDVRKFNDLDYCREYNGLRDRSNRCVFYIEMRPGYMRKYWG